MTLADDAITAAKFDETTAFPIASADTGSTAIARTGADGDTLETLSDEIGGISAGDATAANQIVIEAKIDSLTGYVDTEVTAILEDTGTTIPAQISGLNNLSASQVNAEVDTALADYDGPTKAEMDSGFAGISASTIASAVWSTVIDVLTASQTMRRMLAVLGGNKTKNDLTGTIIHKRQNGTTTEVTETLDENTDTFA